jgi:hypothetical protein
MFIIYLLMLLTSTQETGKVIGRVIYEDDKPAPGTSISIVNTDIETSADRDGRFELEVPAGKHILLTRMMGFHKTEIPIEVKADSVLDLGTFGLGYYYNAKLHDKIAGTPDLKAKASELKSTIVTPHLEQKIEEGKNALWCITYQLAWNEFCDLVGGQVKVKSPSKMVDILNKKKTTKKDLDEKDYVAKAGKGDACVDEIRYELKRKFEGQASPELLNKHTQTDINWIIYAYLFKHLPFEHVFLRYHNELDFQGKLVDDFGVPGFRGSEHLKEIAEEVMVLDYKNDDDFIIELKTTAKNDRLILAKISPKGTLGETVKNVENRIKKAKPSKIRQYEAVGVPVFNFDILREYEELIGDTIISKDKIIDGTTIDVAAQSIRFRLDETGAVLKTEAVSTSIGGASDIRSFIFDKPFLILLKRKQAKNPYFALWVGNSELLVSTGKN